MSAVLIVHPDWGVFLGRGPQGLLFWSRAQQLEHHQPAAVTFEDAERAERYMQKWDIGRPAGVKLLPVVPDLWDDDLAFASLTACIAAGAPPWLNERTPFVGGVQ